MVDDETRSDLIPTGFFFLSVSYHEDCFAEARNDRLPLVIAKEGRLKQSKCLVRR